MPKFLVRVSVEYSKVVEAANEAEAIEQAPAEPNAGEWDTAEASEYEAEAEAE